MVQAKGYPESIDSLRAIDISIPVIVYQIDYFKGNGPTQLNILGHAESFDGRGCVSVTFFDADKINKATNIFLDAHIVLGDIVLFQGLLCSLSTQSDMFDIHLVEPSYHKLKSVQLSPSTIERLSAMRFTKTLYLDDLDETVEIPKEQILKSFEIFVV